MVKRETLGRRFPPHIPATSGDQPRTTALLFVNPSLLVKLENLPESSSEYLPKPSNAPLARVSLPELIMQRDPGQMARLVGRYAVQPLR